MKALVAVAEEMKFIGGRFFADFKQEIERALLIDLETILAYLGRAEYLGDQPGHAPFLEPFPHVEPIYLAPMWRVITDLAVDFHLLEIASDRLRHRPEHVDEIRVRGDQPVLEKIAMAVWPVVVKEILHGQREFFGQASQLFMVSIDCIRHLVR
jgi:hypothetical protein